MHTIFKDFVYLSEREREHGSINRWSSRKREKEKQAPLGAGSP